jgi:hypothetical protein
VTTLATYITQVRRLLHDAQAQFYTDSQLTDYINSARERIVRDTGCLRTLQTATAPLPPVLTSSTPYLWSAGGTASTGDYVLSNIFLYQVTAGGTFGASAPPYPSASTVFPPSTPFTNGTTTMQYAGPAEIINFVALPSGTQTFDILNINLYWGNSRIPLRYLPWTQFNAELRYWQNNVQRPVCFTTYGQSQIYIAPVPDQVYTIELDTIILPSPLVNYTDNDVILDPWNTPVQYYAAYQAKYYEQSFGEAEIFKQEYIKHAQSVLVSTYTRRIPDPYSSPF